jgi:hypothetical protein
MRSNPGSTAPGSSRAIRTSPPSLGRPRARPVCPPLPRVPAGLRGHPLRRAIRRHGHPRTLSPKKPRRYPSGRAGRPARSYERTGPTRQDGGLPGLDGSQVASRASFLGLGRLARVLAVVGGRDCRCLAVVGGVPGARSAELSPNQLARRAAYRFRSADHGVTKSSLSPHLSRC